MVVLCQLLQQHADKHGENGDFGKIGRELVIAKMVKMVIFGENEWCDCEECGEQWVCAKHTQLLNGAKSSKCVCVLTLETSVLWGVPPHDYAGESN